MKTNVLYFGNNLSVLRDRNRIPENSVDLIYLDPPFNSNRNYFVLFKDRTGKSSAAQEQAFEDTWSWTEETETLYKELVTTCPNQNLVITVKALREFLKESPIMAYLVAMAIRLVEMHSTLKETGTLYLHCDPTASHYLKILLDAIFDPQNFKNEIIWKRINAKGNVKRKFGAIHDVILCYAKKLGKETWNQVYRPLGHNYVQTTYRNDEETTGRKYSLGDLTAPMQRASKGQIYAWKGKTPPPSRCWVYSVETMEKLEREGRLVYSKTGYPRYKRYLDEIPGEKVPDIWDDIHQISPKESLGYPTQKPQALLERIIEASSNPGDVVLDPFCGCGTTITAAHKMGRKWIGIDITAVAIAVIKSRMENTFEDLKDVDYVDGFPTDYESARQLFEIDPYRFQIWACTLIGAYPVTKKGADGGIDGRLNFFDLDDTAQSVVVQVKGGKIQLSQIRDFCHVVTREKAAIGFFICMGDVTDSMYREAIKEGFWTDAGRIDYPKVQILNISDLLLGNVKAQFPTQHPASLLGYKAAKQKLKTQETFDLSGE